MQSIFYVRPSAQELVETHVRRCASQIALCSSAQSQMTAASRFPMPSPSCMRPAVSSLTELLVSAAPMRRDVFSSGR